MIIVCQKCATRLQVDGEKSPARPFNVRCPKCNATVSSGVASPASEHGALAVGGSPSTEHPRFEQNTARAYEPAKVSQNGENGAATTEDSVRMLVELLSKGAHNAPEKPGSRPSWDQRKALVCTAEPYRETIARRLTQSGYQVYVAEDTRQAVETMRSNKMDAHAAFLSNVNLVVNVADLDELHRIMEVTLREFNELYRDFNLAFNLTAL